MAIKFHPKQLRMLKKILVNPDMATYIAEAKGWSITGDTFSLTSWIKDRIQDEEYIELTHIQQYLNEIRDGYIEYKQKQT